MQLKINKMLRSGIIIPFQFREHKKLLMIGGPEENRDLNLWDLKNVVRAAFGIYNFEFRNKKIGFNIPEDLLLNYLAQRHDLTNFVIEIRQATEERQTATSIKDTTSSNVNSLSFEPSCSNKLLILSASTMAHKLTNTASVDLANNLNNNINHNLNDASPTNNSDHSSNQEPPKKIRMAQIFNEHTDESMSQPLNALDVIPKSENEDNDILDVNSSLLQSQQQQQQQHVHSSSLFCNYSSVNAGLTPSTQYSAGMINRFRRRGERMSKDQKEIYVKYFEENPCMLTQRRNDIALEPHWNKLAALLNSVPQGAVKNVEEWKQTFDAWRYRVFMYTRYNSKLVGAAAQNHKNYKPLTATDQRAYAMWTSHKNTTPTDFEKMDMFASLDDTHNDYDY